MTLVHTLQNTFTKKKQTLSAKEVFIFSQIEIFFLIAFIITRCIRLSEFYTKSTFHVDERFFLQFVELAPFSEVGWKLRTVFYSYHPPFAQYFVQYIRYIIGTNTLQSSRIVSTLCIFGAFFLVRRLMQKKGYLQNFYGIAFLYSAFSLPFVVLLGTFANIDSITLLLGVATVYLCETIISTKGKDYTYYVLLCLTLILGMYTKYNCIVLLAIPVLYLLFHRKSIDKKIIISVFSILVVTFMAVFPYYYSRYYKQTGKFFSSNTEIYHLLLPSRKMRDKDKVGYVTHLIFGGFNERTVTNGKLIHPHPNLAMLWKTGIAKVTPVNNKLKISHYSPFVSNLGLLLFTLSMLSIVTKIASNKKAISERIHLSIFAISLALLLYYAYKVPVGWPLKQVYLSMSFFSIAYCSLYILQIIQQYTGLLLQYMVLILVGIAVFITPFA